MFFVGVSNIESMKNILYDVHALSTVERALSVYYFKDREESNKKTPNITSPPIIPQLRDISNPLRALDVPLAKGGMVSWRFAAACGVLLCCCTLGGAVEEKLGAKLGPPAPLPGPRRSPFMTEFVFIATRVRRRRIAVHAGLIAAPPFANDMIRQSPR